MIYSILVYLFYVALAIGVVYFLNIIAEIYNDIKSGVNEAVKRQ